MVLLFELIIVTSVWTLGLTIASQEGMILYSWREWADAQYKEGNNYQEVLIRCHLCMPSVHSLIAFVFAYGIGLINNFSWKLVVIYPLVVCGTSLLNGLIWGIFILIRNLGEYYENQEVTIELEDMPQEHHKIHHN